MLSLSSLEGFQISKHLASSGGDESTATPGTVPTDFFGVKAEGDGDQQQAGSEQPTASEPSLAAYFYIIQSQHPLTSAEMQQAPQKQPQNNSALSAAVSVNHPMPPQHCMPPPHVMAAMRAQAPQYASQGGGSVGPPEMLQQPPPWLKSLLEYRAERRKPPQVALKTDLTTLKQSEDALCVALLRAIQLIEHDGPVKAKLKISKMGPASELKDLINMTNELALQCFESLPPGLACLATDELLTTTSSPTPNIPEPCEQMASLIQQQHMQLTGPPDNVNGYGQMADYMDPMAAANLAQVLSGGGDSNMDYYAWSEPAARMNMMGPPPGMMQSLGMLSAGGGGGGGGGGPGGGGNGADLMCGAPIPSSAPPDGMWQPDMWPAAGQMYQQNSPYGIPYPYGLPYQRLSEARRKCGIDSSDLFPTTKKGPSVGDRPLTPPAQGWYAKYSSGVTGVVWDRVHQAWVVSWTLAGKRTFRHFTCKSYGGFDKAREAAIEFRLARNREIAAYNKRCKDKK